MIPHPAPDCQTSTWQQALARAIRDPAELLALLDLPPTLLDEAHLAARSFPLRVPHSYVVRMQKSDPADPLLRQVLPLRDELVRADGYSDDPVGDLSAMAKPGLLHKYPGRVLLVTTAACAIHCRYCFRRHFPYPEANPASSDWEATLDYIAKDTSVTEVIFSGGDPLSLDDHRLAVLADRLAAVPHIKRLRIHTRLPIVLPQRVVPALLGWLRNCPLQKVIVVHANHANEINAEVRAALQQLRQPDTILLNQSVLLAGVNDTPADLGDLSERLFSTGVLPYYLHQLDRVQGARHFEVPDDRAIHLVSKLRENLPGYLVPRLVREVPGAGSKIPLESQIFV